MFEGLWNLASLALSLGVGLFAFGFAREFVLRKLRFVDAVRHPLAPWAAGLGIAMVASPFAILPLVTGFTALVAGAAVGFGTASGVKALRSGE